MCFHGFKSTTALVFAHGGLTTSGACRWQVNQSWISLDSILLAQWLSLFGSAIDFGNVKLSFGVVVELSPSWSEFLAVATPWGVELNEICEVSLYLEAVFLVNDCFVPTVCIVMGWLLRFSWFLRLSWLLWFSWLLGFFGGFFSLGRFCICSRFRSSSIRISFFSLSKGELCLREHQGRKDSEGSLHL